MASPPYGITADLLDLLLARGTRLLAADLVLQRAVVHKYADGDGRRCASGRIRGTARSHRMSTGLALPRDAFRPPPRVDSAVLVVRRR